MSESRHLRPVPDHRPARTLVVQWGAFRRMAEVLATTYGLGGYPLEVAAFMVGEVLGVDPEEVIAVVSAAAIDDLAEELLAAAM